MNICLISQEYPPDTNWGGIATYTQVLARQLAAMGQRVHVVALAVGEEYTTDDMGVTVHRVSSMPKSPLDQIDLFDAGGLNHGLLNFSKRVYEKIVQIHDRESLDVIEAPETCAQGLFTFKRLKGVRTVTRTHTPFYWVRELNGMAETPDHLTRDSLEKMQTDCSHVVTSPTHAMAKVIREKWGIENISVIPNFFNLKQYSPDLSVYDKHLKGADYLLFFGRLECRKGVHVLAQALPEVLERHQGIKAVLVGSDSDYNASSMKSYIIEQTKGNEERVIFIDNIPHAALYPIIEKAKFVVLPSLWENFPYVCLEAMSLGKAVLASDSGGFPEIIAGGTEGILCPPGDVESLKEALLTIIDHEDLAGLGDKARKKAAIYDTEKVAAEMLDFYAAIEVADAPCESDRVVKVGYLLRHFPLPSETFVINEIIALQALQLDIFPVSLFAPERCQQALMSQVQRECYDLSQLDRKKEAEKSPFLAAAKRLAAHYQLSPWYAEFAACTADYVCRNGLQRLHAHFATESALTAMLTSELTGIPFSFTAHAYDIFISNEGLPGETRDNRLKLLVPRAERVITISQFNKDHILDVTGKEHAAKIKVIHCGIDPERFRLTVRPSSSSVRLLSVGRFVEKKGHEYLLRAFRHVVNRYSDATLRLAGDGALKQAMIELCNDLGLQDNVTFLGAVPSDQVTEEMARADIFVLPSVTAANGDMEGIPVSLMEAMATGLPVIASRQAGIPELVRHEVTGYVVDERDVGALAEGIIALAESSALREKLGRAAHAFVKEGYNLSLQAATLDAVFQRKATLRALTDEKVASEMDYWRERRRIEGELGNGHYQDFYTAHFSIHPKFYTGKKIVDIGCGPRGSLEWVAGAAVRVGLDPLADRFEEVGICRHGMQYVAAACESIPFPDGYFDVVTSFNALHLSDLRSSIAEMKRVLKPGGTLLLLAEVGHEVGTGMPPLSWAAVAMFLDAATPLEIRHYEKTTGSMYDSIKDAVPFDHNNGTPRIGILSARFMKSADSEGARRPVAFDSHHRLKHEDSIPSVSVVIPVFNGAETLDLCLSSLMKVDYPEDKFEVIVVDNGSTDSSVSIVQKYKVKLLSELDYKSSYAARNKGIRAARGELIAFVDADCIVTPGWLTHLVTNWSDRTIGCFAGEIEAYQPTTTIEIFSHRVGILRQYGTLLCPYLPYAQTANAAYRKEIFDQIGLFIPELFSGGDAEISWRMQQQLGLRIQLIPEALVYHKHRTSVKGLYRQFKRYEHGKLLWKEHYADYELPPVEARRKELDDLVRNAKQSLGRNLKKFVARETDFVDLVTPFLRIIMAYATYKARV